jgi:molybdopterin synthase catalytic subunit
MTANGFFNPAPIPVERLEEEARSQQGKAVVTLQGVLRADAEGPSVLDHVVYEVDHIRVEDEISAIRRDVAERWHGAALFFRHRLGVVRVGETNVFMAVTAAKKEDALAACHHVLDCLRRLPGLRKRDVLRNGSSHISHASHEAILLSDDAISMPQS